MDTEHELVKAGASGYVSVGARHENDRWWQAFTSTLGPMGGSPDFVRGEVRHAADIGESGGACAEMAAHAR